MLSIAVSHYDDTDSCNMGRKSQDYNENYGSARSVSVLGRGLLL